MASTGVGKQRNAPAVQLLMLALVKNQNIEPKGWEVKTAKRTHAFDTDILGHC